jgi:hypothetical protein
MKLSLWISICVLFLSSCCSTDHCKCANDNSNDSLITVDTVYLVAEPEVVKEVNPLDYIQDDSCNGLKYIYNEFEIKILDYHYLHYVQHDGFFIPKKNYDANRVPLDIYKGKLNYNPVSIGDYGIELLDVYHDTQNPILLEDLKQIAEKLEAISLNLGETMYFPYVFDLSLHSIEEETVESPWYGAMAQGIALSFFCRLYEETGDDKYLAISHKVFQSFLPLKGSGHHPWVSCVDKNGYLWLEEYPLEVPTMALNGKNYAIYGIYDYYRVTKKQEAKIFLMASLTTVKDNIEKYRRENDMSVYCLKHNVQSEVHHFVHAKQLHYFYLITGDVYFEDMANVLETDYARNY